MQIREKKPKLTSVFALILLAVPLILVAFPVGGQTTSTNMQEGGSTTLPAGVTPYESFDSYAQLSFRPNPVGIGQTILINLWVTPAVHASKYFKGFELVITKPDGTQDKFTLDSYRADATAWMEYVVDQVGAWTLRFNFPGGYFPAGNYTTYGAPGGTQDTTSVTSFPYSAYYKPSTSGNRTLTVQQDLVLSWPESSIPTDYWTRPVHVENRHWWTITGNWPATGYVGGDSMWDTLYPDTSTLWNARHKFTPWVQGPESAHIVWKRQGSIGGIIGGQAGYYGLTSGPGSPSIIYAGRCYQTVTKVAKTVVNGTYYDMPTSVWQCYDLRTGEIYWEQTGVQAPTLIEYNSPTQSEVPGAAAAGTWSVNLMYLGNARLIKYNPWTGAVTANVSISPLTGSGGTFYQQGSGRGTDPPMVVTVQDLGASAGSNRYRLIKWTTSGTSGNFTSRIRSNTTYARSSLPSLIDFEAGLGADVAGITVAGVFMGQNLTGYDLWAGTKLWSKNISEPVYSGSCNIVDHGKLAVLSDRGYYVCTDLRTGSEVWKSERMAYPWSSTGFGGYTAMSAYGMLYREAYDGVYAFNWTNGKIVWKYTAPAGAAFETPYTDENFTTVMPFYSFGVGGQIADGKFYTWNYEHTESWPVTRGWSLHCIDCFTGEGVWNITGCTIPTNIADGYLIGTNSYDGHMYVFGKGKSATTVEAPLTAISLGQEIVIKGSVMDISPAQPNTPCVSENSMKTQMDYLHMQLPIDGIFHNVQMTGVSVSLDTLDPNNNYVHIGDVTTDAYSGTFGFTWEPEVPGQYKVTATFMGDASYGSSFATTYVTVCEAPAATATPEPTQPAPDNTMLLYGILIVAIAALVVGLLALLRKR